MILLFIENEDVIFMSPNYLICLKVMTISYQIRSINSPSVLLSYTKVTPCNTKVKIICMKAPVRRLVEW